MTRFDWPVYFASREWALLKEQVRDRSFGRCERCHAGAYEQTHHLNYRRPGHELVDDLMAVCAACHEYLSGKRAEDPRPPIATTVMRMLSGGSWFDEPINQVRCPVCGYEYVHFGSPEHIKSRDGYAAWGDLGGRGDAIDIPMWCESGHSFTLSIGFHKGGTFMFWRAKWAMEEADQAIQRGSWADTDMQRNTREMELEPLIK